MQRTPNSTGQPGTYAAGTPGTVAFALTRLEGHQTFAEAASVGGWADGDLLGVRVEDADGAVWVGLATWRDTGSLELTTEELTVGGTLAAGAVTVLATPTEAVLASLGSDHAEVTVTDGATVNLTLTGQNLTAEVISGAIDATSLLNGPAEENATADQTAQEIATAIDADATAETTLKSALGLGTAAYTATGDYDPAGTATGAVGTHEGTYAHADIATAKAHAGLTSGNPHSVTAADVGLGNADDTADADKPISSATQTALNLKANSADVPTSLAALTDVDTTDVTDGQALVFDDATSTWVPGDGAGSGGIGGSTGAVDNALVRADGTGGTTLQGSGITLGDDYAITVPDTVRMVSGEADGATAVGFDFTVTADLATNGAKLFSFKDNNGEEKLAFGGNGDWYVNNTSVWNINQYNTVFNTNVSIHAGQLYGIKFTGSFNNYISLGKEAGVGFSSGVAGSADTRIYRENATGVLAFKSNGPTSHRIYNTSESYSSYTEPTNYERALVGWDTNVLAIKTEAAGTGTARNLQIDSAADTIIDATGNVLMPNLPTSDPAVAGALWVDASAGYVIKQSQG